MPYSKQIDYLRKIVERDNRELLTAKWDEIRLLMSRKERNLSILAQAKLCNATLKRIRQSADESFNGNVAEAIDDALDKSLLSVHEMESLLRFGPEWGQLLTNDAKPATLYQLEITDKRDGEVYYKVGHTSGNVESRVKKMGICNLTFSVNVHHAIKFREKWCAEAEEKRLHARNASLRYVGAPIMLNGHTEVYMQPLVSPRLKLELCLYSLLGAARY